LQRDERILAVGKILDQKLGELAGAAASGMGG
jgi:hypothetical protein